MITTSLFQTIVELNPAFRDYDGMHEQIMNHHLHEIISNFFNCIIFFVERTHKVEVVLKDLKNRGCFPIALKGKVN